MQWRGSNTETTQEKELADFVSVVLADAEEVWTDIFKQENKFYENPKLVLYTESVESACGVGGSSVGPFYCPSFKDYSRWRYLQCSFRFLTSLIFICNDISMSPLDLSESGHMPFLEL
ncbi:neutral zinc metallopeptidase [Paenibacillus wynnii]|uniref:neutral zinc metallopeptidase n=1 Tax=Paenibacillus wynnii TaxID=268407 RepID=UPI00278DA599|nr:putative metalloprotease [Paenibacillus wynnii]